KSRIFTFALRCGAWTGLGLGLIGLVVAIVGECAPALVSGIALTALSLIVLIWNEHRSWTTRAGRQAAAAWRDRHQATDDRERMLYETIMAYDQIELQPP